MITTAADLLEGQVADGVIADKAYDTTALRELIEAADREADIPSKRNRKTQIPHDVPSLQAQEPNREVLQ